MKKKINFKRFIPAAIIIILMIIATLTGVGDYLSMDQIRDHRIVLKAFVSVHPFLAPLTFMSIYTVATALSIPGAVFLTIIGGFLFPQPLATIFVVISATLGAIVIFLAAKTALHDFLKRQAGNALTKMQQGFQDNAVNYLLFLRLVPIFPFWLVNLAPAFFSVSLFTFTWTTFLGIIPGSFVFAQAGVGLGAIFDAGDTLSIHTILNRDVKIALVALGLFALIPAIIKKLRKRRQ